LFVITFLQIKAHYLFEQNPF